MSVCRLGHSRDFSPHRTSNVESETRAKGQQRVIYGSKSREGYQRGSHDSKMVWLAGGEQRDSGECSLQPGKSFILGRKYEKTAHKACEVLQLSVAQSLPEIVILSFLCSVGRYEKQVLVYILQHRQRRQDDEEMTVKQ